jgi:hypothetical protein
MKSDEWNAVTLTAIGMGLAVASALVTGVMVANRPGHESEPRAERRANDREADANCKWSRGTLGSACAAAQP